MRAIQICSPFSRLTPGFIKIAIIFTILSLVDYALTCWCVLLGIGSEGNTTGFLSSLMQLGLAKTAGGLVVLYLFGNRKKPLFILSLILLVVVIWNATILIWWYSI